MLPKNKIDDLIEKHSLLEKQLSSGDIDKKKFAEKSKEYSDLNEVINEAKQILDVEDVISSILLVDDLRIVKN